VDVLVDSKHASQTKQDDLVEDHNARSSGWDSWNPQR